MSEVDPCELLLASLHSRDEEELASTAEALGLLGDVRATSKLLPLTSYGLGYTPEPWKQRPEGLTPENASAYALAGATAMAELMEVRHAAVLALGRIGDREGAQALISARESEQEHASVRKLASDILTSWDSEDAGLGVCRTPYEEVAHFLSFHFLDADYVVGVKRVRSAVWESTEYGRTWPRIRAVIASRILKPGEPLRLIHDVANLPLNENSDAEAYVWLDRMVRNVENETEEVDVY